MTTPPPQDIVQDNVPHRLSQASLYGLHHLDGRKQWYGAVAQQYNLARPRYPDVVVTHAIQSASLVAGSRILEVGCGPGTATLSFATLGYPMVCLEPNPAACELARQNCVEFNRVNVRNCAFEEWGVEPLAYDAVLAATSFHWIPAAVSYPKAAAALKPEGHLVLLWNKELYPSPADYALLSPAYQAIAPHLDSYEDESTQVEILQGLGTPILDSGLFQPPVFHYMKTETVYTAEAYLMLLSTYSRYINLSEILRERLFHQLADIIHRSLNGRISLSYFSACHVAQKC